MMIRLFITIGCTVLFLFNAGLCQIRIDTIGQQVFLDEDGSEIREMVNLESNEITSDPSIKAIKQALRTFDFTGLKDNLTPILWKEKDAIMSYLHSYSNLFNQSKKIGFYENAEYESSRINRVGVAHFYTVEKEIGVLRLLYTYEFNDGNPIINSLVIAKDGQIVKEYPMFYSELKSKLEGLDAIEATGTNDEKIKYYTEFTSYLEGNLSFLVGYMKDPQKSVSSFYGSLAWYNNLAGDGRSAVLNSQKGLKLHDENVWINTNLALGYLISGEVEEAKKLYIRYKDTPFRGASLKSMFLDDLKTIEAKNILLPNVDEIRAILR